MVKIKEIIRKYKNLKEIAWLNRGNTLNNNDVKTKKDIEDFLNKEVEDIIF